MENNITIDGIISLQPELHTSPSGIQSRSWTIQHQSERFEVGIRRKVWFRILVIASGSELVELSENLTVGQAIRVNGFISSQKTRQGGTRLSLYCLSFEPIELTEEE